MSENDQDGVLTKFPTEKRNPVMEKRAQKEQQDLANQRKLMLARTSLTPYQASCLKNIPLKVIRNAWFTLSHLLLEPGSMVAVMGCGNGAFAYAMAVMNPDFHIIGLDQDKELISQAKKTWQLTNLEFVISQIASPSFPNNSLDAVVNSFTLHETYSRQGYNEAHVREMLDNHFALLKTGGLLFLRDYIHPPPGEYVMIEFPDKESLGENAEDLSEADLLVRFSEEAKNVDNEGRGFFLEELSPYYQGTRLFRLPHKWAYEFILRKDSRDHWREELSKEYTFMTAREIRKTLRNYEARTVYTAPYWDPSTIRNHYQGHFRLYDDDGRLMGYPSTSHVFLARKIGKGESTALQERRPSQEPVKHLRFYSVRNTATGGVSDLVSRDVEMVEFLPYRISDNGRLNVFLHEGLPRAITNAVPRSGRNIDDKRWSGHMVEAIGVNRETLAEYDDIWTPESTYDFALKYLGLSPANNVIMEQGPEFYPNPAMIDERIETKFLNVQKSRRTLTPRWVSQVTKSFSDAGKIREYDAQHILNAISVGLIPNARLERQILALFSIMGIKAANWADTPLHLEEADVPKTSYQDLLKILTDTTKRFKKTNETAGSIRSLHSYFVDEGYEDGKAKGLAARDIEFIIEEGKTLNTAVVLPLIKSMSGEVMAGYIQEYLPVPDRMGKNSKTIRAPSFNLPPEVKDMDGARAYVAEQFSVGEDRVISLGESYYIHNGMTPQRIFPFAVTDNIYGSKGPGGTFTEYAPIRHVWILQWHLYEDSIAVVLKRALERMHVNIDFGIDKDLGMGMGQEVTRWGTPPPFGMPIASSPEEHDAMVNEFKGHTPKSHIERTFQNKQPTVKTDNALKTEGLGIRKFAKRNKDGSFTDMNADRDAGGDSTSTDSGSSSGSGGGMENSNNDSNENKQNQQQRKAPLTARRFDNIDYSNVDGDKPQEEKTKEKDGRKAPVVSILRPPPSRKPSSTNKITEPSFIADNLGDEYTSEEEQDFEHDDISLDQNEQPAPER